MDHSEEVDLTDVNSVREQVGSVAHDLNNHLTAVMGYTDILRAKLSDNPELLEYASMAAQSADTMSTLTQKLLVLGGRRKPQ